MVRVLISQKNAMKAQRGKQHSQGHSADKEQGWDLNLGCSSFKVCSLNPSSLIASFNESFDKKLIGSTFKQRHFRIYWDTSLTLFGELSSFLIHVNPWLIHDNVWQKPLQYCKVISLQLIKINGRKNNKIKYIQMQKKKKTMSVCLSLSLLESKCYFITK